jgi:toxin secretion/phage lysis holin
MYINYNTFKQRIMPEAKIFWYITIIYIFDFLDIQSTQVTILSIMMIIDTISWISKQWKLDKFKISSHSLWQGLMKKILTMIFLFSFALMFKGIEVDGSAYIKSILSILIMSEFYSIVQNIYSFRTWKKITEYDVISVLLKYIWDSLINIIEKKIWRKK